MPFFPAPPLPGYISFSKNNIFLSRFSFSFFFFFFFFPFFPSTIETIRDYYFIKRGRKKEEEEEEKESRIVIINVTEGVALMIRNI